MTRCCMTSRRCVAAALVLVAPLATIGCFSTTPDYSGLAQGPAPLRIPSPERTAAASDSYEDSLTGGQVFTMYCAQCHNPRPLAERPFSNFKNVAVHMRVRANLTGKEYAKLVEFLHRFHDVPPPTPPPPSSPKRFIFSQPIAEQRDQTAPPRSLGTPGLPPLDVRGTPDVPTEPQQVIVPTAGSSANSSPPQSLGIPGLPPLDVRGIPDLPAGQLLPAAGSNSTNPPQP